MIRKLEHWVYDYLHALRETGYALIYRNTPKHYLGYTKKEKAPIVLIPGVYEKWYFLKRLGDALSHRGHPVYVLPHLGYNVEEIRRSAKLVRTMIDERELKKVIILAHSKGGLIAKYIIAFYNKDKRIKKVIAIASPFGGTDIARYSPLKAHRELRPESPIITKLNKVSAVNRLITSIYGVFDNHVWPEESCHLKGAKNIRVNTHGHHRILFDPTVRRIVLAEVN